jgi:hypothetical protein
MDVNFEYLFLRNSNAWISRTFSFCRFKILVLFQSKLWIMCFICSKLIFNTTTNFTKTCDVVLEISYYLKILWKKWFKSLFKICEHLKRNYPLVYSNILHFIFLKHVVHLFTCLTCKLIFLFMHITFSFFPFYGAHVNMVGNFTYFKVFFWSI